MRFGLVVWLLRNAEARGLLTDLATPRKSVMLYAQAVRRKGLGPDRRVTFVMRIPLDPSQFSAVYKVGEVREP